MSRYYESVEKSNMQRNSKLLAYFSSSFWKGWVFNTFLVLICALVLTETRGLAQRLTDYPIKSIEIETPASHDKHLPVTVTTSFDADRVNTVETALQFILGACAIWTLVISLRRKEGTRISTASLALGILLLIDALTLQTQLNWWFASGAGPYDAAIGLLVPGAVGAIILLTATIMPNSNRKRLEQVTLASIAIVILITSASMSCGAWPSHRVKTDMFY
jgi:hypothetical protein